MIPENGLSIVFDETSINSLRSLLENLNGKPKEISADLVMGKKNDSYHPLTYSTICYFFAQGNTVLCRTDAEQYEVNKKLYLLEAELLSRGFLRINKSVIINVIWIAEIIPWFGGKLLLKVKMIKDELEVSRNYVPAFKNFLGL
ncbi:MAG: LytTR family transcriptional regulator [Chitinispirillaceae bacterium]|nr:LytTR family transcriptional regulator [Chitinispirillaceae bacterium]